MRLRIRKVVRALKQSRDHVLAGLTAFLAMLSLHEQWFAVMIVSPLTAIAVIVLYSNGDE